VEFGTLSRQQMQKATMAARWLWATRENGADTVQRERLMRDVREAFYPSSPQWRAGVLEQSKEIIDRGLAGIAKTLP